MTTKMSRGVQQDDVWAAADALIAQGLRPTIERVRQHMGRGSPNTVSPMLEAWFSTLGPRLGVSETPSPDRLPVPVQKAALSLWEHAQAAARDEAAQAFAAERAVLTKERNLLAEAQAELSVREEAMRERQAALDEALKIAQTQAADLSARLAEMRDLLERRDTELASLHSRIAVLDKAQETARRAHDEALRANAEERRRLDERYTATEHRWLGELDRARQEVRQLKAALTEQERRSQASRANLESEVGTLNAQLREAHAETNAVRDSLEQSRRYSDELRGQLVAQRAEHANAHEQRNHGPTDRRHKVSPARKRLILRRR